MKSNSPIPKIVREALTEAGWEPWFYYCDKIKNGRKRKWMRNGAHWSPAQLKKISKVVIKALDNAGVEYTFAGWKECEREGYGPYWAFIVRTTE